MISSNIAITERQETAAGRSTILVAVLLVVAVSIGFMLMPTMAQAASSSTSNYNTWVTDGVVEAIVNYNGITYIGGGFTRVGPVGGPMQTRNNIAAIDATTGAATSWNPHANGGVYSLAISGTTVYVGGGTFTTIGGKTRNNIAAINATTGAATSWNPHANGGVISLAISGTTVYAGGTFTTIGGKTRNNIAAINATTGNATSWNPDANGGVYSLAISGTTVYAGGTFTTMGGQARSYFAEFDSMVIPSTWYLAEGTIAWGFGCYITIQNPNAAAVTAKVTYMPTGAANKTETVNLPARSQTTLTNDHLVSLLGQVDFSTKVESLDATKTIAVDRTMTWTGPGASSPEAHSSIGVTSPARTWYLPEGSTNWNFECWLLIQNPNAATAHCTVTYMTADAGPKVVSHDVPANARASFSMAKDIGAADASIKVVSNVPVIPERAMYRNNRREGHDSIGTTTPASDYYLAEGTSAWGFTTYVLVQNPNSAPDTVTITYMTPSGSKTPVPSYTMPPNSRMTVRVNDVLPNTDFSTQVHGSLPVIAERSMYWGAGTPLGEACHDSIGMASAHTTFYLPDGQTLQGRETWTLVQNPNAVPVSVEVSYLPAGGGTTLTVPATIKPDSRMTFNMADKVPNGRASIMVTSKTPGKKIMVERSMYWNSRGAGTDTIGGYGD